MRLPPVNMSSSSLDDLFVDFCTTDGCVRGTALRASGMGETHYDVVSVIVVRVDQFEESMAALNTPATFEVFGKVSELFEDGVAVVSSCGFDFWVSPEECHVALSVGDCVAMTLDNLTLYV